MRKVELPFRDVSYLFSTVLIFALFSNMAIGQMSASLLNTSAIHAASETIESESVSYELLSFEGKWVPNYLNIEWSMASNDNLSHLELERKTKEQEWTTLGNLIVNPTTSIIKDYHFSDYAVEQGAVYQYRLKLVTQKGNYAYSDLLDVTAPTVVEKELQFFQAEDEDAFNLKVFFNDWADVEMDLLDITGSVVTKNLVKEEFNPGTHIFQVDTSSLPQGIYQLRYRKNGHVRYEKINIR